MHPSSDDDWPTPNARTRELLRAGAERVLLAMAGDEGDELLRATMAGLRSEHVADDPTLVEGAQRVNAANLRQWAGSNVSNPGARVPPYLGPEAVELTRDLVRRGLDGRALDSYRTAQSVASQQWMDICFDLTDDPAELKDLLDVSLRSIATFLDDTIDAVTARVEADLDDLTKGTNADRTAAVTLLLEGAPIARERAEHRLGHRLTGDHTAAIVWVSVPADRDAVDDRAATAQLEAVADALVRAAGVDRRLTVVGSARSHWIWLPTAAPLRRDALADALDRAPDVFVAVGRSGRGVDGFRRSHLDASATQRMLARLTSRQRFATYQDVQLVDLLTNDLARADEFVADTLGSLVAEPDLQETLAVYIEQRFNAARTAEVLVAHRNTVLRRLERADHLLPRPLAENVTNVAAALAVLRLRPIGIS